jgi:hypothetical protein
LQRICDIELISGSQAGRPCVFTDQQAVTGAGVWYDSAEPGEIHSTGHRCWLTVDSHHIAGLPSSVTGYVSVFTDEVGCVAGRVEVTSSWPKRAGVVLYAHRTQVLPPIDAVFARGSKTVGEWIASHGWTRDERYNDNFKDRAIVEAYERICTREFPIYFKSDVYGVLGGWHFPFADHDWHDLIDEKLMVFTIRNSEPWVEAWVTKPVRSGRQRLT